MRDTADRPVAGAVVHLGDQVAITDNAGRFEMRAARARRLAPQVALGEFLAPGRFELVSAPPAVVPALEDEAAEVVITVRRI